MFAVLKYLATTGPVAGIRNLVFPIEKVNAELKASERVKLIPCKQIGGSSSEPSPKVNIAVYYKRRYF